MLVIINWLIKTVYYKLVKVTINILGLGKVIINIIVRYHDISDFILAIRVQFLLRNFGYLNTIFLVLSTSFSPLAIYKLRVRLSIRIVQ